MSAAEHEKKFLEIDREQLIARVGMCRVTDAKEAVESALAAGATVQQINACIDEHCRTESPAGRLYWRLTNWEKAGQWVDTTERALPRGYKWPYRGPEIHRAYVYSEWAGTDYTEEAVDAEVARRMKRRVA